MCMCVCCFVGFVVNLLNLQFDTDYLSGQIGDLRWLEGKTGKKRNNASEDPAVLEKLMVSVACLQATCCVVQYNCVATIQKCSCHRGPNRIVTAG